MSIFLLSIASVLIVALYQIIDERKRLENLFKCLNKKTDSLFVELQTAEKAAQMLASYQDECH